VLFSFPIACASASALTLCLTLHFMAANVLALPAGSMPARVPAAVTRACARPLEAASSLAARVSPIAGNGGERRFMPRTVASVSRRATEWTPLTGRLLLSDLSPRAP
jgi:hypothetical protein